MKTKILILGTLALVLSLGSLLAFHHSNFRLTGFDSKHFTEKDWFEDKDREEDKDRPTDEDKGGDDSLKVKKKMYDLRAFPATTIPEGSREKAWQQFQKLYPENQTMSWKPITPKVGGNGR